MIYEIVPEKSALLIIDVQQEYFMRGLPLFIPQASAIVPNLVKLRELARERGIATVFVQHVYKEDGSDVGRMGDFHSTKAFVEGTLGVGAMPDMAPGDGDVVVKKTRYSSFVNTRLNSTLQARGIDTVIITGLMTNYCSVTTARHAHDLDYKVIFVCDANFGPDMPDLGFGAVPHAEVMKVVATSLAAGIADVVTTAQLAEHLLFSPAGEALPRPRPESSGFAR